ncbi:hypothetical protein LTS10_012333 [Elasticomyces elasticus]|nr:hypothetical protein LTS10_012333 [Elasticomyces elasticus]
MPPKAKKTKAAAEVMEQAEEDQMNPTSKAIVACKAWKTDTKLVSGGKIMEQEAQWNVTEKNFGQIVEVLHNEAFVLKPLYITEGQFKGRHVLMLEPVNNKNYFRFMDLPPELRKMVYEILLSEVNAIEIETHKVVREDRRPVRKGFGDKVAHNTMKWESATGKWIGQVPSTFALLRVSKQLLNETAPVAYGSNVFNLDCFKVAELFLKTISSMRQYFRAVQFGQYAYQKAKARGIFDFLADAVKLRSITIKHRTVCAGERYHRSSPNELVEMCWAAFQKMHTVRKTDSNAVPVLDLLQIDLPRLCFACKEENGGNCEGCCGSRPCSEVEEHGGEVAGQFRVRLAGALGIEEDE